MAENKKSFVIYCDIIHNIQHLTDEEKGQLFQHLLEYVNDLNPVLENRLLLTAWKPIETQLKRDLKKWEQKQLQRIEAGRKSAEVRKQKSTTVNDRSKRSTNPTVNVNGNVNDSVNVIYNKFVDEVKSNSHDSAIEQMYRNLKIRKGALTPLLEQFKGQLIIDNKAHENTLEFRMHFNNWLNTQDRLGKLQEFKKVKSI